MMDGKGLERLIEDFNKCYSKATYFEKEPIIQYMRMAYSLGLNDGNIKYTKKVIRSDGKKYGSLIEASKDNLVHSSAIKRGIDNNRKSAGYFWKYA